MIRKPLIFPLSPFSLDIFLRKLNFKLNIITVGPNSPPGEALCKTINDHPKYRKINVHKSHHRGPVLYAKIIFGNIFGACIIP